MPSIRFCLLSLLLHGFLHLSAAALVNATYLVPRADGEPGDTLDRMMCFCTDDNGFTQAAGDPYEIAEAPPGHKVAFVYEFEYYNRVIDHHFALHYLDVCTTNVAAQTTNPCLKWRDHKFKEYCHRFYTKDVPKDLDKHNFEFCYGFNGDMLSKQPDKKHIDSFRLGKELRHVPRKRDWILSEEGVKDRCTEVCRAKWDMEMLEDPLRAKLRLPQFSAPPHPNQVYGDHFKHGWAKWSFRVMMQDF
ncbi:MAG: hypothetical protein Q9218_002014 [Villophora microphyllina]